MFAPAALSLLQIVVLGVAIGAGAVGTWWAGRIFRLRRADIRAKWTHLYGTLRGLRFTPPVAVWYATKEVGYGR